MEYDELPVPTLLHKAQSNMQVNKIGSQEQSKNYSLKDSKSLPGYSKWEKVHSNNHLSEKIPEYPPEYEDENN